MTTVFPQNEEKSLSYNNDYLYSAFLCKKVPAQYLYYYYLQHYDNLQNTMILYVVLRLLIVLDGGIDSEYMSSSCTLFSLLSVFLLIN